MKSLSLILACCALAVPAIAEPVLNSEKSRLYEADYAAVLAANAYPVGVAVYGQYDADYDVYLTSADLFQPLLGNNDADYEAHLDHDAFAQTQIASR